MDPLTNKNAQAQTFSLSGLVLNVFCNRQPYAVTDYVTVDTLKLEPHSISLSVLAPA